MTDRRGWRKLLVLPGLCLVFFAALFLYGEDVQDEFRDQEQQLLMEMSAQNRKLLDQEIQDKFNVIEEIARRLKLCCDTDGDNPGAVSAGEADNAGAARTDSAETASAADPAYVADIAAGLSFYEERYHFKRMGIALADGRAFTSERLEFSVADRNYFAESLAGKTVVSQKMTDKVGGEGIIVFCTPIYADGQVCGALFATYSLDGFREITSIDLFNDQGYAYIVRSNGDCVVDTDHPDSFDGTNILQSLRSAGGDNAYAADILEAAMARGESGQLEYKDITVNNMYFEPLMANDWYLLSIVPSHVFGSVLQKVVERTAVLGGVLIAIFCALVLLVVYGDYEKRRALHRLLYVDMLTGYDSYAKFCMELRKCMERQSGQWAFIAMDLHQFRLVNELFGHDNGDAVLRFISRIWAESLHRDERFGRRHGDNFEVLMKYDSVDELCRRLDAFCHRVMYERQDWKAGEPFLIYERQNWNDGEPFLILPVMGIYLIQDFSEDIQNMQNNARMACATIKERNDVHYAFFDETMKEKQLREKRLGDSMELAMGNEEFLVYYQPKVDPVAHSVVGAEALVRWRLSDGTFVPPSVFIPLAEHNGLISELDQFMFRRVCRQLRQWKDKGLALVPVSVNLSRVLLYNKKLPAEYASVVEEYGIPFEMLQLEITESEECENLEEFSSAVGQFHDLGFRILMDDFGTGYSSMKALQLLPIDVVKLDKCFIDEYASEKGRKILISMIKLAHLLDMEITAEGVETREQADFMEMTGCHSIQGFFYSKPLPEEDFEKLLTRMPEHDINVED